MDLFGCKKTKIKSGVQYKNMAFIFWLNDKVSLVKNKAHTNITASFATSDGWNDTVPIKGISGSGAGFNTIHRIAPLAHLAKLSGLQGKNLATKSIKRKINEKI